MRLASFEVDGQGSYGIVTDDGIIDLGKRLNGPILDLRTLLEHGVEHAAEHAGDPPDLPLDAVAWLPVVPNPSQIYCVGLNYRAHADEVARTVGERPTVFIRVAASQVGHRRAIVRPRVSEQLDYEGELALVIGRRGRHIASTDVGRHLAGYSLYNDASVRDWQRHSAQYTAGKNFPATGGFGPWLVTSDEIADPAALSITTLVNGEVLQHAPLADLIFPIPEIVAYVSSFTELLPGDVIATGTPAGVGAMREPPRWLVPGEEVEVRVEGIGTLVNRVADEAR